MKITEKQLKDLDACSQQVELFVSLTGGEVEITEEWCLSVSDKFDWHWASRQLLNAPARAEYERAQAPAWAEYERVRATAWAEYDRAQAKAFGRLYGEQK